VVSVIASPEPASYLLVLLFRPGKRLKIFSESIMRAAVIGGVQFGRRTVSFFVRRDASGRCLVD
jgi:hypothetical protein